MLMDLDIKDYLITIDKTTNIILHDNNANNITYKSVLLYGNQEEYDIVENYNLMAIKKR